MEICATLKLVKTSGSLILLAFKGMRIVVKVTIFMKNQNFSLCDEVYPFSNMVMRKKYRFLCTLILSLIYGSCKWCPSIGSLRKFERFQYRVLTLLGISYVVALTLISSYSSKRPFSDKKFNKDKPVYE